ncbi:MAG: methylenetetrahydrofolate reductase C-terminal domain-containing protein [Candidatus Firestonebacteria bacterium]|nr:methylenetetrahydrofolate reductase C-terminal domain-containing protein [Candidatus Firestonebacteria bacterium]
MIISKQKDFSKIQDMLKDANKVFLVGCTECASMCYSGGEKEVNEMKIRLEEKGKIIAGEMVVEAVCNILNTRKELRHRKDNFSQADAVLVLCCGAGVQSVVESSDIPVYPGCDTLFLGNINRIGRFYEHCSLCGECLLDKTGGICPVTNCAKGLLNGPCGGMNKGKCEINPLQDCAWVLIYNRMEKLGKIKDIKEILPPRNYSRNTKPSSLILEKK